jgi:hypothetical protein
MWSDHTLMLLAREKQAQYMEEARQERLLKQLRQSQARPALRPPGLISKIAGLLRHRIPTGGQRKRTKKQPSWTR